MIHKVFRGLILIVLIISWMAIAGCSSENELRQAVPSAKMFPDNPNMGISYVNRELKEIWLAGGCFWDVEAYLSRIYGVAEVTVRYANGKTKNPSYADVCYRDTGHAGRN